MYRYFILRDWNFSKIIFVFFSFAKVTHIIHVIIFYNVLLVLLKFMNCTMQPVSSMTLTMPEESPDSGKYVVYTVTSDDSSTELEDGHVNFKDTEMDSLNGKQSPSHRPLRSYSSDSSKWSTYWSTREKCCCLWNITFILAIGALVFVVVYVTKRSVNNGSFDANYTWNLSEIYVPNTISTEDSKLSKVYAFLCIYVCQKIKIKFFVENFMNRYAVFYMVIHNQNDYAYSTMGHIIINFT